MSKFLPVGEAYQQVTGNRINPCTIWRHCSRGSNGVFLKSVFLGRKRYTTIDWLCEFIEQVSIRRSAQCDQPLTAIDTQSRKNQVAKAASELSKIVSKGKK
jgi:hypothetical protein